MIWVAAAVPLCTQGPAENPATACTSKNHVDAATVGKYQFTAYKSGDGACIQATSGGKVVYSQSVDSYETFTLGQPADAQYNIPAIANGTDVTGRGRPNMIASLYTGGAHCCTIHYVFELEPQFKLLATLNDADDDLAHFRAAFARRYSITAAINYYRAMMRSGAMVKAQPWMDRKIEAPTLLIWGEQDVALGKELTYGMEGLFTGPFQIKYIPDSGHWVQQEKPELVNRYIREFLTLS